MHKFIVVMILIFPLKATDQKASADKGKRAERAWIMVDIEWPKMEINSHNIRGAPITISFSNRQIIFTCKNEGKTPAWLIERRIKFENYKEIPEKPDIATIMPVPLSLQGIASGLGEMAGQIDLSLRSCATEKTAEAGIGCLSVLIDNEKRMEGVPRLMFSL